MRAEDRDRILVEVTQRLVDRYTRIAEREGADRLEDLIGDTLYHEKLRLEKEPPNSRDHDAYRALYDQVRRELPRASAAVQSEMLHRLTRRFAEEIVGNFNPWVYRLSTRLVPAGLSLLLGAAGPRQVARAPLSLRRGLSDNVRFQGEVEHVRALLDRGTLLVTPTHSSNLDSVVLGYAVYLMGIPPLLYGAGLNLFTNPVLSFFMGNLGAYRVDRRKKSRLYKDVLKEYSTCALEMGYHSLFFPGGTRSRSGMVESRLKKGLLGTGLSAYIGNLQAGSRKPGIYVVPCTISYKLVLEASTLMDDYLADTGRSRYIIDDDESTRPRRIYEFMSGLISLDDRIEITFSSPMDVFGNRVDREGRSLDPRGRVIDPARYVERDGEPVHDAARDRQYTIELAERIRESYLRDNVVMSTHVVACALCRLLEARNPRLDRYRLLRTGGDQPAFPMADVHRETERVLEALRRVEPRPRFEEVLEGGDIQEVVSDALRAFSVYHRPPPAYRRADRVFHEDRNLLLYYRNRLRGYDLGRTLAGIPAEGRLS